LKPDWRKILIIIVLGVIIFSLTKLVMMIGISFTFFVNMPDAQLVYPVIIIANILYWYLLSCLIAWGVYYKRKAKRKRKLRTVNKIETLENVVRHTLRILLVLNFFCLVFVYFINPEAYFFGEKLSEDNVKTYLLTGSIAGIAIAHLLFKRKIEGEILSLLYFGYFFVENLITNLFLGLGFIISPLFTVGLVVSIILLMVARIR